MFHLDRKTILKTKIGSSRCTSCAPLVCLRWEEARFRGVRTRSVMGEKFKVCREIYFGSVAIHYKSRPQGRDTGGSKKKKKPKYEIRPGEVF